MPIRQLPTLLVNQIAAGEVIERPASVVKELVENSIDAGATRIDIAIEDGGRELVRISDDGSGIPEDELVLAVAPHATSKIEKQEDLNAIATLGFRGEALASIASISRMTILTRTKDQAGGAQLDAEGESISSVKPAAATIGTTITIRNLFFNTPARRKFLRTAPTEASRISSMVESIALAHPHIAFTLQSNTRKTIDLSPEDSPRRRVIDVLGKELKDQLLEISIDETAERGLTIWGMIGLPEIARGTANNQRLYLNGRLIRDRSLQHALKEAYRGLIEPGRYPTLCLFIEMDPRQVDVNVHPTKAEVRFRNQSQIHGAVLRCVRDRLREADLTPQFDLNRTNKWEGALTPPGTATFGSGLPPNTSSPSSYPSPTTTSQFVDYFKRLDPKQKGFIYSEVKQVLTQESPEIVEEIESTVAQTMQEPRAAAEILQVHSSYLVTQDESGIVIIDQHALHERVMFEQLTDRISKGNLESQRLLMPEIVEADRMQVERIEEMKPLFERIGIEAEAIGPTSIAIHAFPSFLFERNVDVQPFIKELLEREMNEGFGNDVEAALHETLDMMACKAAIKAGDKLSQDELKELLVYRDTIERSSNCPHGRPTSLRLTIEELDKQFGRT